MSKINVDTWEPESGTAATLMATGDTVTVPSGATLAIASGATVTNSGTSTGFGATNNIQRATGDVTIATTANYDVDGKSSMIVSANAAAANRTITLCPVGETGMDACVITVICDADATSTYELKVVESDGTTEVWTGYQKGDFVRLIVSNSAWLVVDHKATYYARRYLTATATVGTSATTKLTGWTNVTEIGNTWDNANDKLTTPTGMNGYWNVSFNAAAVGDLTGCSPTLYINGAAVSQYAYGSSTGGYLGGQFSTSGRYYATSTQDVEFYSTNSRSDYTQTIRSGTHFTAHFERVY